MTSAASVNGRQILASIRLGPPESADTTQIDALVRAAVRNLRKLPGARLPFDPFECARGIGIQVRYADLPSDYSGHLHFESGIPTVELNPRESRRRHRFTMAHELAHLCFLQDGCALPSERGNPSAVPFAQRREEQLCNKIATELLLPATSFKRKARELTPSLESLEALATSFDVSREVVLNRLEQLRTWSIGRLKLARLPNGRYAQSRRFSHRSPKGWRRSSYVRQSERTLDHRLQLYFRELWRSGPLRTISEQLHAAPIHRPVSLASMEGSAWATFENGHIRLVVFA